MVVYECEFEQICTGVQYKRNLIHYCATFQIFIVQFFELLLCGFKRENHFHSTVADSYCPGCGEADSELCLHILFQACEAGLKALFDFVVVVCPDAVFKSVLPFEVARRDGSEPAVNHNGLDSCGA